jgi:hypothetical protein
MADDKCSRKRADFSTSNRRIDAMIEDSNVAYWPVANNFSLAPDVSFRGEAEVGPDSRARHFGRE